MGILSCWLQLVEIAKQFVVFIDIIHSDLFVSNIEDDIFTLL